MINKSSVQCYEEGLLAAQAGRPRRSNPHVGARAERWRRGYNAGLTDGRARPIADQNESGDYATPVSERVLALLRVRPLLSIAEIAQLLGLSRSRATGALRPLELADLLVRSRSEDGITRYRIRG